MVDVGKFLKRIAPEEVNLGDIVEVLGEGYKDVAFATSQSHRRRLILPVKFKGVERELPMGSPSIRRIARFLGFETSGWVGHKLKAVEKREIEIENRHVTYVVWEPLIEEVKLPKTVECPNCGVDNPADKTHCWRCRYPLKV